MDANSSVDHVLRRYLLGTAPPEVREEIDRRLFSEDKMFWEQLCLIEDELVDDYITGELDQDERERFEQSFLISAERRERVEFARTLRARAQEEKSRSRSWTWFSGSVLMPAWMPAAAALLLALGPLLTWQLTRSGPAPNPTDVSHWLSPGLVRTVGASLERVEIPPDAKLIYLRLDADDVEYPAFRATLHGVGGEELLSQARLKPALIDGREAVTVTVPAALLEAGDYYIRLAGERPQQTDVPLDRYDFRVLR